MEASFLNRCDPASAALLLRIGAIASTKSFSAYLVGGMVRDVLLGVTSIDPDIMLEPQAPSLEIGPFVQHLHDTWHGEFPSLAKPSGIVTFPRYGTAKLLFSTALLPGVSVIDFSAARSEYYPEPGKRPVVEPGNMETDLARRDFSVNAMAVRLSGTAGGSLVDLYGGKGHLAERKLEILHRWSFHDDPVRLIRAIRLIVRYRFTLTEETRALFDEGIQGRLLTTVPIERRFEELKKVFSEECPLEILAELDRYSLLSQFHPALSYSKELANTLEHLTRSLTERGEANISGWKRVFLALCDKLNDRQFGTLIEEFRLNKKLASELRTLRTRLRDNAS